MLKKSLLSLAVTASLVGMTGCNISSTTDNIGKLPEAQADREDALATKVHPLFNPAASVVPLGSDFFFTAAATSDGTANTGAEGKFNESPVTNAIDDLDGGISTLSSIDVQFNGSIDPTTVSGNVYLVKLPNKVDAANMLFPEGSSIADFEVLDLTTIGLLFQIPANVGVMIADQPVLGTDYEVTVITQDGVDNNTIRVNPLKPLESETKYILLVNGSVKDATGESISPSPDYESIRGTKALVSNALTPVRSLLQALEQMAGGIITAGGANPAPLADGIAFTAPYTTGNPTTVLKSMAYPGYWAASAVAKNNATVAGGLITTAIGAGLTTQGVADSVNGAAQSLGGLSADEATIFTAGFLLSGAMTSDLGAGVAYENPRARDYAFIENVTIADGVTVNQVPLVALNANTAALGGAKVLISQGAIELPQYTTTLTDVNPVSSWQGNTAVGAFLDSLSGASGVTPPSDVNGSKNVTYRYPFAQQQRTAVVPLMFIEPVDAAKATAYAGLGATAAGSCARTGGKWPVIISQHGFTVHRAGTTLMGTALAQNTCSVVVAMDLPHHGIAPLSTDRNGGDITNSLLGLTVTYNSDTAASAPFATAANTIATADPDSLLADLAERHEGMYLIGVAPLEMTWGDTKAGKSGDFFIQLGNFQRTRDNNRQAVMDLLNLNATLATIDIDGDGNPDLDTSNVRFVGHSLGAITGTNFVAVNNDKTVQLASKINGGTLPLIQAAVLATPGGGLTKLLENSVSISPAILGGLSAVAGIQQGDSNFESFMKVLQATTDSADPMNFVSDLKAGGASATPTMLIEMIGGGSISSADSNESTTSLSDALIALGIYPADTVVPNNTDAATVETAKLPLAGTDGMISLLGSTVVDTAGANQVQAYPLTQFNQGTHGTFSSADSVAVFTEMATEAATFVGSGGAVISVTNDAILGEAP